MHQVVIKLIVWQRTRFKVPSSLINDCGSYNIGLSCKAGAEAQTVTLKAMIVISALLNRSWLNYISNVQILLSNRGMSRMLSRRLPELFIVEFISLRQGQVQVAGIVLLGNTSHYVSRRSSQRRCVCVCVRVKRCSITAARFEAQVLE